jgi:hypothetical protein
MQFEIKGKINNNSITEFEIEYDIDLPSIYKEFLKEQNGGTLDDLYIYLNKEDEYVVESFLGIKNDLEYIDLSENYMNLQKRLPKSYFPIAIDGGGNYYLLKLGTKKASIYFWDHNLQSTATNSIGLKKIANSFNDFIENIKLDEVDIKVKIVRTNGSIILSAE